MNIFYVIGVMSGTSIDGVDIVYVKFTQDESWSFDIIHSKTYKYENSVAKLLIDYLVKALKRLKKLIFITLIS